ncbi:MAG: hypothetical protein HY432_00175 [Candidatus Liptonbacteria bacterium]|nr:hypothetical protein [Candidatus Liptonbacteria bacterium]
MDIKTRNRIFYALCGVFIVAGTGLVFYAQGWRPDIATFEFKKVGGIYLKSFPSDAKIFLDGKYTDKKPGLLNRGRFIDNLFPKTYRLSLSKDGYLDWSENIQVYPSLVSEIKYAILVPKKSVSAYDGYIKNFSVLNDWLIVSSGTALASGNSRLAGSHVLWQDQVSKSVFTENPAEKTYFVNYFSGSNETSTPLNPKLNSFGINPRNIAEITRDTGISGAAIFRTGTRIFSFNSQNGEITQLIFSTSTITQLGVSPSWIAWTTFDSAKGNSNLWFYWRPQRSLQSKIELEGKTTRLSFSNKGDLGILQEDGSFYIGKPGVKPEKTASDAKNFSFSDTGDTVSVLESQAIEIFSLTSEEGYWRFRISDAGRIEKLEWYADENHLFVVYPEKIMFLDISDEGLENFLKAADGGQGHYDTQSNTLYFIKNNELRKIFFPR